jgi:hypothetical protein
VLLPSRSAKIVTNSVTVRLGNRRHSRATVTNSITNLRAGLQPGLQNTVLCRQVFILQQEFLIDQSGNVRQEGARMCLRSFSISIIENRGAFTAFEYFDRSGTDPQRLAGTPDAAS